MSSPWHAEIQWLWVLLRSQCWVSFLNCFLPCPNEFCLHVAETFRPVCLKVSAKIGAPLHWVLYTQTFRDDPSPKGSQQDAGWERKEQPRKAQ